MVSYHFNIQYDGVGWGTFSMVLRCKYLAENYGKLLHIACRIHTVLSGQRGDGAAGMIDPHVPPDAGHKWVWKYGDMHYVSMSEAA